MPAPRTDNVSEEMVTDDVREQNPASFTDRASYDPEQTREIDENPPEDEADPSLDDLITNAQWVIYQKQEELTALADLSAAEVNIAKRSIVVTGIATLAGFVFSCFCWLIANISLALTLHHYAVHNGITALIVFILNLILAVVAFLIANQSYRYITLMPAIHTFLRGIGVEREPRKEK
jgi:hypothetical protein